MKIFLFVFFLNSVVLFSNEINKFYKNSFIDVWLEGRLGNQLFQVANGLSLAKDNNAHLCISDLSLKKHNNILENKEIFFSKIDSNLPKRKIKVQYLEDRHFVYKPVPFSKDMKVFGYFQSEKYFKHNKNFILNFFEPSQKIKNYLNGKYGELIANPKTVGIHLRAYSQECMSLQKDFPFLEGEYYNKAMEIFPEDSLFVIFSDKIDWAKKILNDLDRPHIFIEGEHYSHDLYLLSYCKHQILSSSTFGWWGAYLNKNPNKIVVAPDPWFCATSGHDTRHIIPEGWVKLTY